MDASEEEIAQPVRPEKKPRVDGEPLRDSPTQAMAVTKVLEDGDLLWEIMVRLGLPNHLVRAALVCKRWLDHASDRKFLSRFRELHPPRLLGCYIHKQPFLFELAATHFVPMLPQPPELAAVMRSLESYTFGARNIMYSLDGDIFTRCNEGTDWRLEVHRPLCTKGHTQIFPPVPQVQDRNRQVFGQIISTEEGCSMSYLYVLGEATETQKFTTSVYVLQDGEWIMRTSATCPSGMRLYPVGLHFGQHKIYLANHDSGDIVVLDLMASSYSTIQLPEGVKYRYRESMLSRAGDASSVYLIHVKEFHLRIWLHKGDNWLLVDTICLDEMLANLGMSAHKLDNGGIANGLLRQVGDNGQYAIFRVGQCMLYLDIKCRTLCKVYENKGDDPVFGSISIHPLMMIWPPTFPSLKDDRSRKLLVPQ